MKRYIKGVFTAAIISILSVSCSDFLNEPIRGRQDLDNYYTAEDECKQQITGCYQALFFDDWWQIQKFYVCGDMCTDDEWMGNTTQDPGEYRDVAHYTGNTINAGNCCQNFWQYRYKGILRCNIAIQRIADVNFNDVALRARYIAEAKALRAFMYLDLVKNFGGVPLVLGLKMPSEVKGITRATKEATYAQIEKDLLEAISDLPKRAEYASADLGRITSGAAKGLLAKAYLYQGKYQEAEPLLQDLCKRGSFGGQTPEYKLLANFADVWSMNHNNSEESLFEVQTNSNLTYNLGERISVVTGSRDDSGWSWGLPTSNLEQAFKVAGDSIRLLYTIIKDGATLVPGDDTYSAAKPYRISADKHKSARCNMKLYIPKSKRPEPYDAPHIPLNYRLLRYADVLLMYAEVENALNNDSEAQWALNQVRARVNLAPVMATGTQLRNAIRLERRLELALENNRLYDLRRWKDDNGKTAIQNVMGPNGSFVQYNLNISTDKYEKTNQKENSNKGYAFREGRDELFPIPNSEITMSEGSIQQNPLY